MNLIEELKILFVHLKKINFMICISIMIVPILEVSAVKELL
jgi:hypothetical protein